MLYNILDAVSFLSFTVHQRSMLRNSVRSFKCSNYEGVSTSDWVPNVRLLKYCTLIVSLDPVPLAVVHQRSVLRDSVRSGEWSGILSLRAGCYWLHFRVFNVII